MTSFAKHIAVLAAALIATTVLAEKSDDDKSAKPDSKETGAKKPKRSKGAKAPEDPNAPKKKIDIPVVKGHDSLGLIIPYFDGTGKRQMNFKMAVASRLDEDHVKMKDLSIETFNEEGEHEMQINVPDSIFDSDKSAITTQTHVTISRDDFTLSGESMIFYTRTKQGGLAGNVHMIIYNNLKNNDDDDADKTDADNSNESKDPAKHKKAKPEADAFQPDTFKTSPTRQEAGTPTPPEKLDKFLTPSAK
jgi:hypothetical protein